MQPKYDPLLLTCLHQTKLSLLTLIYTTSNSGHVSYMSSPFLQDTLYIFYQTYILIQNHLKTNKKFVEEICIGVCMVIYHLLLLVRTGTISLLVFSYASCMNGKLQRKYYFIYTMIVVLFVNIISNYQL